MQFGCIEIHSGRRRQIDRVEQDRVIVDCVSQPWSRVWIVDARNDQIRRRHVIVEERQFAALHFARSYDGFHSAEQSIQPVSEESSRMALDADVYGCGHDYAGDK